MNMTQGPPFFELPEPDAVIVVYDAKTGAIRHVHQEVTLPGGSSSKANDAVQRAIAFAEELSGASRARLQTLALDPQSRSTLLQSRAPLKIDVKKRQLVLATARPRKTAARRSVKATSRRRTR